MAADANAADTDVNGSNVFSTSALGSPGSGDILVIRYVTFAPGAAPSAPSGWNTVSVQGMNGGTDHYVALFWLLLSGSADASYTVNRNGGSPAWDGGSITKVTGADGSAAYDSGFATGTASTLSTGAVVDSPTDGCMLMVCGTDGGSMSNPSGMTQQFELDGGDVEGWYQNGALSGATKTTTVGGSVDAALVWVTFGPAGGGGSPKGNPLRSKALYSLTSGRVVA